MSLPLLPAPALPEPGRMLLAALLAASAGLVLAELVEQARRRWLSRRLRRGRHHPRGAR